MKLQAIRADTPPSHERRSLGLSRALPLIGAVAALAVTWMSGCQIESADRTEAEERVRRTGFRGILMEDPPPRPDFTLTDTEGELFDYRAETEGFVSLLFFGYTHCPDICPVHMANIGAVKRDLPVELQRRIKVVLVTTDPERDTPERLRGWLDNFDPAFVGLRGTAEQVDSIMVAIGMPPSIREDTGPESYLVGHASQVLAFPPDGSIRVIYPFGTRQADWRHDLPKLAELR
jgi:protein SCO1/2